MVLLLKCVDWSSIAKTCSSVGGVSVGVDVSTPVGFPVMVGMELIDGVTVGTEVGDIGFSSVT